MLCGESTVPPQKEWSQGAALNVSSTEKGNKSVFTQSSVLEMTLLKPLVRQFSKGKHFGLLVSLATAKCVCVNKQLRKNITPNKLIDVEFNSTLKTFWMNEKKKNQS